MRERSELRVRDSDVRVRSELRVRDSDVRERSEPRVRDSDVRASRALAVDRLEAETRWLPLVSVRQRGVGLFSSLRPLISPVPWIPTGTWYLISIDHPRGDRLPLG